MTFVYIVAAAIALLRMRIQDDDPGIGWLSAVIQAAASIALLVGILYFPYKILMGWRCVTAAAMCAFALGMLPGCVLCDITNKGNRVAWVPNTLQLIHVLEWVVTPIALLEAIDFPFLNNTTILDAPRWLQNCMVRVFEHTGPDGVPSYYLVNGFVFVLFLINLLILVGTGVVLHRWKKRSAGVRAKLEAMEPSYDVLKRYFDRIDSMERNRLIRSGRINDHCKAMWVTERCNYYACRKPHPDDELYPIE